MQELRFEKLVIPAADIGPENPLPPLQSTRDLHADRKKREIPGIPDEILRNMAYGHVPNILPYTLQDGYTRLRQPRELHVAILENETLRATFFLEYGGRLYSLEHKPSGRELLDRNPVFQPANLALRNAWYSGGVEWNIGTIGHCPFTCSPLFVAQLHRQDGTPILRMYEWERIRRVPFQIDAYLPSGSPVLFVRVRITNANDTTTPMYWWSNIAVPETQQTRVIVPADAAYSFGYGGEGMARVPIPETRGVDVTYPTNITRSADFFFDIPENRRHWITALDQNGSGLIQTSTARLKGRKLFLWGMGMGGRRWQTFLSQEGQAYIEIQAGLARTQREHIPMPAGAEWTWLEAYGLLETDASAVHGPSWVNAQGAVEEKLEQLISAESLDNELARTASWADRAPESVIQRGSGWGALEQLRRQKQNLPSICSPALQFDAESLGEEQAPWVQMLNHGVFPNLDPHKAPSGYMIQNEWHHMLGEAVKNQDGRNWSAYMHLGIMRYQNQDLTGARQAWEISQYQCATPWLARNLAVLAVQEQRFDDATELYTAALRLRPDIPQLAIECGRQLLKIDRPQIWLDLVDILPENIKQLGRIRLLEGQAALEVGDLQRVAPLFDMKLVIDDLREGERSLSHLWFSYHEKRLSEEEGLPVDDALRARVRQSYPVPKVIDFRMSSDAPRHQKDN
jgi:hypothetical protein